MTQRSPRDRSLRVSMVRAANQIPPPSSRIAAVRRLFNDGGVEVVLFFFSALQSSVL